MGTLIQYNDFSNVTGLRLNSNAAQSGSALRLTPDQTFQRGSAFFRTPFALRSSTSFQTQFQFRISGSQGTNGADGFTFILQNSTAADGAIGTNGGALGYGGISNSVAVKFDTRRGSTAEPSSNYVGLMRDGNATTNLATGTTSIDFNSGSLINAWIDYDSTLDRLDVYVSNTSTKPGAAVLSQTIDLASIIGSNAYAGFSAATGGAFNAHEVQSWQLSTTDNTVPDTTPPTASLTAADVTAGGGTTYDFTVTYSDDSGVNVATIDDQDILVTGPDNFSQIATRVSLDNNTNGSPRAATYRITAPGGTWNTADNGVYGISIRTGQVSDTSSNFMASGSLGSFSVNVPPPSPGTLAISSQNILTVNEGDGTAIVTVVRTGGSEGIVSVDYETVDNTAIAGSDYTAVAGRLTFDSGETSKTISIPILNDSAVESLESFNVALQGVLGGAILGTPRTATINITDNDTAPPPGSFSINYSDFSNISQIRLNGNASQASNALQLTPDAAARRGSAFFRDAIDLTADTSFQTQFRFRLYGTQGTTGSDGMTFILQNTAAGAAALGNAPGGSSLGYGGMGPNSLAIEFDTHASGTWDINNNHVAISRDGDVVNSVAARAVPFDLNSGTPANAWIDYDGLTDSLSIYVSTTATKPTTALLTRTIDIPSIVGSRAFIGFSAATGGGFNAQEVQSWSFVSSAAPPTISFGQPTYVVNEEGTAATITVTRSINASTGTASVSYATSNGTATAGLDYTATSGTLSFASGETTRSFTIPIANDGLIERNETINLTLSNPVGAELGTQTTAVVRIMDDDPGNFVRENVITGLTQPTAIDWDSQGRMFIAQKSGVVRLFENGSLLSNPFIDISNQVNNILDRGLLDIAVDPQFHSGRPYVYLLFTYDPPEVFNNNLGGLAGPDLEGNRPSRLVRVTADPSTNYRTALAGSEVILLGRNSTWENISRPDIDSTYNVSIPPSGTPAGGANGTLEDYLITDSQTHSIGSVEFGTDGSLFVTNGDGASFGLVDPRAIRVQDINSLSGKVLRINPDTGAGVSSNPFFDAANPNSNRSKVYSYGFRNPFRMTIKSDNTPYVSDVGWNTWEEVNVAEPGKNYGWPYFEGGDNGVNIVTGGYFNLPEAQAFYGSPAAQQVQAPLFATAHANGAIALAVGDFYTGSTFPSIYNNALFVTDLGRGTVDALLFDAFGKVESAKRFASGLPYLVQMTTGPDSNLYYVDLFNGRVGRWRAVA